MKRPCAWAQAGTLSMGNEPLLILQPRRMGDLILTFPLVLDLRRKFPQHPIWIAARETFFKPLMPFSPDVVFFPHTHLPNLGQHPYELIVNLGTDSEACIDSARASVKFGPIGNPVHVEGFWQLYRTSLTQNNRHNLFHWSDLFRMDISPAPLVPMKRWLRSPGKGRIGLFVGASEAAKRPAPPFWAGLSARLSKMGFKPVLLGGPGETALGQEIMAQGARAANFCGKTNLAQLASLLKTLDLLISPDTGPMHLADWLNVPVLNLSLGNVQAAETGPIGSDQHILRANMSCSGCWGCVRTRMACHLVFKPSIVASIAVALVVGSKDLPDTPGLELLRTTRDKLGLYTLVGGRVNARMLLDNFWRSAFLHFSNVNPSDSELKKAGEQILGSYPALARSMGRNLISMLASLASSQWRNEPLESNFWRRYAWHCRLFAGHMQMTMQNEGYSKEIRRVSLERLEKVQRILAP